MATTNTKVPPDSIKNSPLLYFCCLPPRPMVHTHSLCLWPSLGANMTWTFYNQATATRTSKLLSTCGAYKNTQVYKRYIKSSPTPLLKFVCIRINLHIQSSCFVCLCYNAPAWMQSCTVHS